jgi:hypothetical protein
MMGSCSKVELVWQVLLWLAAGTILDVACQPLAASTGSLDFGRLGTAA